MDRIALRLPVFGTLCRKLDTTRFARTLSVLLDAGVDVGSSIDLTADVLRMSPIRQAVRSSREQIMAGKELSATLDRTRQFTPDVIAVIESGEETGKLPESLAHLADDYDEQVSIMVANLGHLVQPLMIVLLGGIVLFIILAVFLPIIQMITRLAAPSDRGRGPVDPRILERIRNASAAPLRNIDSMAVISNPEQSRRSTRPSREPVRPLENGDRLSRDEFERRYDAMPNLKKAELIEGEVYVASPARHKSHSVPHANLLAWIVLYCVGDTRNGGW